MGLIKAGKALIKYGLVAGAFFYFGYYKGISSPRRPLEPLSENTSYLDYTVRELVAAAKNNLQSRLEGIVKQKGDSNGRSERYH